MARPGKPETPKRRAKREALELLRDIWDVEREFRDIYRDIDKRLNRQRLNRQRGSAPRWSPLPRERKLSLFRGPTPLKNTPKQPVAAASRDSGSGARDQIRGMRPLSRTLRPLGILGYWSKRGGPEYQRDPVYLRLDQNLTKTRLSIQIRKNKRDRSKK